MKNIIGIDPSTRTGVAVIINGEAVHMDRIDTVKEEDIHIRGARIVNELDRLLTEHDVNLAGIEGYAMNGGFTIVQMVTIGTMIRDLLIKRGIEWFEIPPTKLKQLTTGKGKATKAEMCTHVLRKYGIKPKNNDIGDAIALAMVGHHAYNLETMSKSVGVVYPENMIEVLNA